MKNHHSTIPRNFSIAALAFLSMTILPMASGQVGPILGDRNLPVLLGNISLQMTKPSLRFGTLALPIPPRTPPMVVEGRVRFAAVVHRLNPGTYEFTGDMPPSLGGFGLPGDGSASVKMGQYKLTARRIVEAALPDGTDPSGMLLLWRSQQGNIALGSEIADNAGDTLVSPLQVGKLNSGSTYDAKDWMSLTFWGSGDGLGLLEAGRYTVRPNPPNPPNPLRKSGRRQGFIYLLATIQDLARLDAKRKGPAWLLPSAVEEKIRLDGMLNIRRRLKTVGPEDFGPNAPQIGSTYEVGSISGRFFGSVD